ncbi:uncharacterized protein LOC125667915 isoform X2 [Ostrea edulis]|uniref:uncharacterized protein LOC125683087 isoform X2 n=1 Tax=Ostrea edulis TaxID=37623 RepID=UPI0024AF45E2|nr:uncharacterized protein LOC125683087 isoform X2 [Ostrea edulis]XP_056020521.1 uncharacterized protein LOC125667915 isoform X2 [Ostrea edulis]
MPPKRKRDGGMVSPARGRGQKKSRHNTRQQKPGTKVRDNQPPFQHQESSESVPGSEAAPDLGEFVPANFGNIVGQIPTTSTNSRSMASTTSQEHLGNLKSEANRLIQGSLSVNTYKAYQGAFTSFKKFLSNCGIAMVFPIPIDHLLNFIAHLSISGTAYRTAALYISALSYFHKLRGIQDNTQSFIVKKALQGLHKKRGNPVDPRIPLTISILQRVVSALPSVCRSPYEAALFSTIFSIAYHGLLRVSEVLSIHRAHISLTKNNVSILIPRSKTDQIGNTTTLQISKHANSDTCPVQWVLKFLRLRPNSDSTLFFIHMDYKHVTRYQFNCMLQKTLKFNDIQGHFRPHSFRIGRATDMAKQGVSDSEIKSLGRWESNAFQNYIRL